MEKHDMKSVVPVYIGDDSAFHSIKDIQGGLFILVTGGDSQTATTNTQTPSCS